MKYEVYSHNIYINTQILTTGLCSVNELLPFVKLTVLDNTLHAR